MKEKLDPGVFRMIESINRAPTAFTGWSTASSMSRASNRNGSGSSPSASIWPRSRANASKSSRSFSVKRNIRFECAVQENLPPFLADAMRMQQVFTNLFTNALKFSPDNSVVQVRIGLLTPSEFHIVIKDQG